MNKQSFYIAFTMLSAFVFLSLITIVLPTNAAPKFAPVDASYIVTQSDPDLTNEILTTQLTTDLIALSPSKNLGSASNLWGNIYGLFGRFGEVVSNTISVVGTDQSLSLNPTGTGKVLIGGNSLIVKNLSSDPTGGQAGQIYFNTTLNKFRGHNGTLWASFVTTPDADNTNSIDLELDSSQYLSIADGSQTGLEPSSAFTFEAWIKLESVPAPDTNYNIVAKHTPTTNEGYEFGYRNANGGTIKGFLVRVNETADATDGDTFFFTQTLEINTWYHVALTWLASTKTARFYLNGVQVGGDQVGTNASSSVNNGAPFTIGANGTGTQSLFDGLIDDVRMWSVVRTGGEINSSKGNELTGSEPNLRGYWRLNGGLLDETTNNNDLVNNGAASFSTSVPF